MENAPDRLGLAARRRFATQVEIALAAADLFDRDGYESTTAEAIANRAGVALRTFYRHCSGKDDVFTAVTARNVEALAAVIASSPPAEVVEQLVAIFAGEVRSSQATHLDDRTAGLLLSHPQLRSRLLAAAGDTHRAQLPVAGAILGAPSAGLRASALAAALLAAIAAGFDWSVRQGAPLRDSLTEALAVLYEVLA
ncbi:TetR/AcrR family transcriptional regulator [Microbacterium sp. NPDC089318]